ncbi:IclR family transcriptional regulator [Nonomuraea sp. NPDC050022]|uniref:IclR family transcriptional regulator n=1 Tax=Nonomuraea sp. NPDC050022 TaxID=3364358 RepID=UPI0037ADB19B
MGGNTRDTGRSTASRLLALLGAFSSVAPVLTLSELAERSGLPIATAHRLAGELLDWGALERTADGQLQIGLRLWHTGALAPRHRNLRSVALPFMEDLYEATHENVQLAVRDGIEAVFLDKISGRRSVGTLTTVAGRLPLHATGVGKIILAFSEPELLSTVVAQGLRRCTPHTIVLPRLLCTALRRVREHHVAFSLEEMTIGASSVAAPIFGPDGGLVASLALVVRSTTGVRTLSAAVRTAALGVTRNLDAFSAGRN